MAVAGPGLRSRRLPLGRRSAAATGRRCRRSSTGRASSAACRISARHPSRGQRLHQDHPCRRRRTRRNTPRRCRGSSSSRATDWLKDHQAAATRYVEMMLDMMRQWEDHARRLGQAGHGHLHQQRHDRAAIANRAGRPFRDGGYFSVNGGINFAATQKIMDLFFKLRERQPERVSVQARRRVRHRPPQSRARQDGRGRRAPRACPTRPTGKRARTSQAQ